MNVIIVAKSQHLRMLQLKNRALRLKRLAVAKQKARHTVEEWISLWHGAHGVCAACGRFVGRDGLTKDHIIPLAKGGSDGIDNLRPACGLCNYRRRDRPA